MKRQAKHDSDPEEFDILRSEMNAAYAPRVTKGYWDSSVMRLLDLSPDQVKMLVFRNRQAPLSVRSSIHAAAARAGLRVGVKVNGPVVYFWRVGTREKKPLRDPRPAIRCKSCGKRIVRKAGTSWQYVCAGEGNTKSECQKDLRHAREHRISIAEAKARRRR